MTMTGIKKEKVNGQTVYNTLDLSKRLGKTHQKLKEKCKRLDISFYPVAGWKYGEGLPEEHLNKLLTNYELNGVKLIAQELRKEFTEDKIKVFNGNGRVKPNNRKVKPKHNKQNFFVSGLNWILTGVSKFLESKNGLFFFVLILTSVQASFITEFFTTVSGKTGIISVFFGFGYELTGLTLALNGGKKTTLFWFSLLSCVIIALTLQITAARTIVKGIEVLILSICLPFMTYSFSEKFIDRK